MENAILHNIRCLSVSHFPSYDLKNTLTSLSSKIDREYTVQRSSCENSNLFPFRNPYSIRKKKQVKI